MSRPLPPPDPQPLSFLWHDYETFGIDPSRDAPAQFAAIRTDAQLQEIGQPLMMYCRPPRDGLPHPKACMITGLTPQHCQAHGILEAEFARTIHAELSVPGTAGVGYNSLKFDDGVSRHLFWRNLLDVYGREWQNGCSRWDLFNVVRAVYAFRPDVLQWPTVGEPGRHSLKLEHLSAANGLLHESAHDALSDVRATIGLARLIRERVRPLWDHCLSLRQKTRARDLIGPVTGQRQALLHVSGMYPQERGHLAMVLPLGAHPRNNNEFIVWDLAHDPLELLELDVPTIRQRLFTRREELPQGMERLPLKTVRINESPVLATLGKLSAERAEQLGIDLQAQRAHARAALARAEAFDRLPWSDIFVPPPPDESLDAEQRLYQGFVPNGDRNTLARLPALDPQALATGSPTFEDKRLEDLLLRYRARNWPQSLNPQEQAQWAEHCQARLHQGKGGHLSLQRFQEIIDEAYEEADEPQQQVLEALIDWAEEIAPSA